MMHLPSLAIACFESTESQYNARMAACRCHTIKCEAPLAWAHMKKQSNALTKAINRLKDSEIKALRDITEDL